MHRTRLQQAGGPWAKDTVTYGYNNARLRTSLSLQQSTGTWTNGFLYDAARRLTRVTSPAGAYTNAYRGAGTLVTNLALPNGSRITNAFDNVGRLTMTRLRTSGGTTLNTHSYLYNQGHQRTRQTRTDGSYASYTYDNIGQLKTAIGTGGHSTENLGYGYDTAWNLNTRTNMGTPTTFTVDVRNQLTGVGTATCSYDNNGNLTYWGSTYGWQRYLSYDAENRLVSAMVPGYGYSTFLYDGRNRLRRRVQHTWDGNYWVPSSTNYYVYMGNLILQERDAAHVPVVAYTRGQDLSGSMEGAGGIGGLLGRSHSYSGGNWSTHNHYHADGNGNITMLVNSSQSAVATYRYDPYGNTLHSSGTLAGANLQRFSSKLALDVPSMALYYYGYRFYAPDLQRWIKRDPIEESGGINLYSFVGNEPTGSLDPNGLKSWLCRRAIGKKPGSPPPARGPFYHQYYCVQLPGRDKIDCYGQTADRPWGPGKPSSPKDDAYDPSTCQPIKGGSDCLDRCLARKGKEKRLNYWFFGPGKNCQEWSNDAIDACLEECPPACNSPFTANTYQGTH
jgi:RHS repeat-associated protein